MGQDEDEIVNLEEPSKISKITDHGQSGTKLEYFSAERSSEEDSFVYLTQ